MPRNRQNVAETSPFDEDMGAPTFIERYCGLVLRPWQLELIEDLFELDAEGRRKYRVGLIGMGRKNGKSSLGAALALYALVMDRVHERPQVFSVAGDRQQARVVFDEARAMAQRNPTLTRELRIYRSWIEHPRSGGIYRVLSADAALQQGLGPTFVIFDEVHVQPNEDLWAAMRLGMGARAQPMLLGITTAGFDKDTLAWRLYDYGQKIAKGEVDDPRFFFRWWEPANRSCAVDDRAAWLEANPALGDFLHELALEDDLAEGENQFRRYHLNQWTTTRDAWLPHGAWEAIARPGRVVTPDEPVVIGFDGSWTNDSTAIIGCTVNDPHLFLVDLWEPANGEKVDSGVVEAAVLAATQNLNVVEIPADPHQWREPINRWAEMGLPVHDWATNSVARMVPACTEFHRAVVERRLTHDGDPRLARHVANAVIKVDRFGARIVKETSRRKIDAAVAAVIAYDRALHTTPAPIVEFIPFD